MKLIIISDTHGKHAQLILPPCDMLIHCGDMMYKSSGRNLRKFLNWFAKQPARHKIFIAGNHDVGFEISPQAFRMICRDYTDRGVRYLQDSSITIDGLKFYGSPWQPAFFSWAFNLDTTEELAEKWALIPSDTDVLITHGPPYGILDQNDKGIYCGCKALRKRVFPGGGVNQLKLHAFGHIHEQGGRIRKHYGVQYVNASILNLQYQVAHGPIIINYER